MTNMIPTDCKRLAEVDFPIAVVSRHAVREKSIRHGHPSTLHLWWARRPLAACRAMLMALLLPDPCESLCPDDFKLQARALLPKAAGPLDDGDAALRKKLLEFIGSFANWDNSAKPMYLEVARGLVRAAYPDEPPLVVDPFAGGGSIPLEALRVGCEAFASDLNPVACLILKIALEYIPRQGPAIVLAIDQLGQQLQKAAERDLAEYYPPDPDGAIPLAFMWAKTVRCETPNCGAEVPLIRSLWLCKKPHRLRALRLSVIATQDRPPRIECEVFSPNSPGEVQPGTIRGAKATCPCCRATLLPARVMAQLTAQRGGANVLFDHKGNRTGGARLLAVFVSKADSGRRDYRNATDLHYDSVWRANLEAQRLLRQEVRPGVSFIPREPVNPTRPSPNARGLSAVTRYGVQTFADLFSGRQLLALVGFVKAILQAKQEAAEPQVLALLEILSAVLSKRADYGSVGTRWHLTFEKATCTFSKQALANTWEFVEASPLGNASGSFGAGLQTVVAAIRSMAQSGKHVGHSQCADASRSPLPDSAASIWFTDPPYYDAIPYADLSDFFFVWLKRALSWYGWSTDPATGLTPKLEECVWNQSYTVDGKRKDGEFFEKAIAASFTEGRRVLTDAGVGCVVFAHKTTEGWEALLSGMIRGGWVITGSWPIATERVGRLQSQESAALATSVHLVCRPRPHNVPIGDWTQVLRELPRRVGDWMERLQSEGIRGADLVFACIGPALEIFSRHSKVETPEGREVKLPEFLEKVWEVVGRSALEQILGTAEARARNSAAGVLEEDARLTALFLWTLQATNHAAADDQSPESDEEAEEDDQEPQNGKKKPGFSLIYDVVRRFAQPLGIRLKDWEGRIIETNKGVVRLLPIRERAPQLFGEGGADLAADRIERAPTGATQLEFLFDELAAVPEIRPRGRRARAAAPDEALRTRREATTLDRVHAAMLLQASGRSNALRAMLKAEIERSPDFLRLANALSALYPDGTQEKRLVQAMVQAAPR